MSETIFIHVMVTLVLILMLHLHSFKTNQVEWTENSWKLTESCGYFNFSHKLHVCDVVKREDQKVKFSWNKKKDMKFDVSLPSGVKH
jgi:hypothetical protein